VSQRKSIMGEKKRGIQSAKSTAQMIEGFVKKKGEQIINPSSPLPIYCQVENFLRQLICELPLSKGTRLPSDRRFAELLSISHLTLRRAQERLCEQGLLLKNHGKGTFVGDTSQLRVEREKGSEQRFIGLVIPSVEYYYSELIRAVEEKAREADLKLVLSISDWWDPAEENRQLQRLLGLRGIKGILISPPVVRQALKRRVSRYKDLMRLGISVVCIDRDVSDMGLSCVFFDDRRGAKMAVTHLVSLGHRRIGFVSPMPENLRNQERFLGYKDALKEAQIPYDKAIVVKKDPDRFEADLETLMNSPARPTAIFCINDYCASMVAEYVSRLGISVPEELAICGYDGPDLKRGPLSFLTTIFRNRYIMGVKAVEILLRQMRADRDSNVECVILSPELIVKGSCGAKPISSYGSMSHLSNLVRYA